jgi:hypothetical protein
VPVHSLDILESTFVRLKAKPTSNQFFHLLNEEANHVVSSPGARIEESRSQSENLMRLITSGSLTRAIMQRTRQAVI